MRFYRPTIKQPISTFVEAPIDFMQQQMIAEQKTIDDSLKAVQDANKEYLGVRPGLYSNDLFSQFQDKYKNQFSSLVDEIYNNPQNAMLVAPKLAKLNSEYKQDPLYQEITKDFVNYTQASQKLAGSDKPYYFNRVNQLKVNPDGTVEQSNPQDYMTLTDQGSYNQLFDEVAKFKPKVYEENGKRYATVTNLDGTSTTIEVKTEKDITELETSRISEYLNNAQTAKNFEYQYRDAAVKAGNPALANDPTFRQGVYNQLVSPIKQQAYQQIQTAETISSSQAATNNSNRSTLGNGTQASTSTSSISKGVTQVKKASPTSPKTGQAMTNPADIQEGIMFLSNKRSEIFKHIQSTYKDVTGQNIDVPTIANLYGKFKMVDGKPVPITNDPTLKALASNYNFQQLYGQLLDNDQVQKNMVAFDNDIKKAAGVDKYNPQVLKDAENKAKAEIYNSRSTTTPLSEKVAVEQFNKLSPEEQQSLITKFKDKYDHTIQKNIPKDSPEYKIYETLDKYNNKQEYIELRQLPSGNEASKELKKMALQLVTGNLAGNLKNMVDNTVADIPDLIEGLPKNKDNQTDFDAIEIGYFADPNEGMKGYFSIPDKTGAYRQYEFPMEDTSLQKVIQSLDPTEAVRMNVYNQAIKSLEKSYGQEGVVDFGDGFKINFKETTVDDKQSGIKFKYKYQGFDGITKYVDSISEMFDDVNNNYMKSVKESKGALQEIKQGYDQMLLSGQIKQEEYNKKMQEAFTEHRLRMVNSPLGKQQEWVQTPKKPLQ